MDSRTDASGVCCSDAIPFIGVAVCTHGRTSVFVERVGCRPSHFHPGHCGLGRSAAFRLVPGLVPLYLALLDLGHGYGPEPGLGVARLVAFFLFLVGASSRLIRFPFAFGIRIRNRTRSVVYFNPT